MTPLNNIYTSFIQNRCVRFVYNYAEIFLVFSLLLLSTFLFFYKIDAKSMWLDEIAHHFRGRASIDTIMNNRFISCGQMSHAYYLMNRWAEDLMGNPDFSTRLPEAVSAVLTVLFIYLICRHLLSWDAGLIASLFFMTSSFIVKYAQMNRYYHLGSIGTIASFYFFVAFLDSKKWGYLIGWILAMSFFMRAHNNGLLTFGTFGILTALLCITTYATGKTKIFYEIRFKHVIIIGIAAAIVLLLWMPYTIRIPQHVLTKGAVESAKKVFDSFWTGKVGLGIEGFMKVFYQRTMLARYLSIGHIFVVLALSAAIASSILWKKSRILLLLIFAFVPTVIMYHVMNNSKAELLPKRVLQLYPLMVIILGCGFAALPRLAVFFFQQMLPQWLRGKRYIKITGKAVFLSVLLYFTYSFILPLIGKQFFYTIQYYYSDQVSYKVIAKVLTSLSLPDDIIVWHPKSNDAWLMKHYMTDYYDVKTITTRKSEYENKNRSIDELIEKHPQVWLHRIDLKKAGYSEDEYIPFSITGRDSALVRKEYKDNKWKRTRDAIRLYNCILENTSYPETAIAEEYRKVLEENRNNKEAEKFILSYRKYRFSEDANRLLINYFSDKKQPDKVAEQGRRFADYIFWIPRFQIQAAVYSWRIEDYDNVIKYAKRALLLPHAQDYFAYELIARVYEKRGDMENALKYARKAYKNVQGHPRSTKAQEKTLQKLYTGLLGYEDGGYRGYSDIKKHAKNGITLSLMNKAEDIITTLTTNVSQRVKFEKNIQKDDDFIKSYITYLKENTHDSKGYTKYLKEKTMRQTWPFYVSIIKQSIPREIALNMHMPYDNLQKRGFPKMNEMSTEEVGIIGKYYEQLGDPNVTSGYWAYVAENAPHMRSYAEKKQADTQKHTKIYINDTETTNLFPVAVLTYTVDDAVTHSLHYAETGHGAPCLKWGEGGEVNFNVTLSEPSEYDIVMLYASDTKNPLDVYVNNVLQYEDTATAITGGWKIDKAHNVYVGPVKLNEGVNIIKFKKKNGSFFVFYGFSLYKKTPSQMEDVK